MYHITRISIENLMSYENETITPQNQTTIIYGENFFDKGQKNNGSGKSAILEALAICFTGKPLRKDVTPTDLIRDGQESMKVGVVLNNSSSNKTLEIDREFFVKKHLPQKIVIKENDNDVSFSDVNHANTIIIEYLGIEKDDLLNYYLISKDRYISFFKAGDSDKKTIISRFSGIDLIDSVFEKIDSKIKEMDRSVIEKEQLRSKEQGRLDVYFENSKKQDVKGYQSNIQNSLSNINMWQSRKKELEKEISSINIPDILGSITQKEDEITKIDSQVSLIQKNLLDLQDDLKKVKIKRSQADGLLINRINCPKCDFEFITTNTGIDINKVKDAIPILDRLQKDIEDKYRIAENQINVNNDVKNRLITEKNSLFRQKQETERKLDGLKRDLLQIDLNISKANDYIEIQKQLIENIEKDNTENLIEQTKIKIKQIEKEIVDIENQIVEQRDLRLQFTDFRISLINKTVKVIEFYCNRVLHKMKSSLSVNIEGYRYKKDGNGIIEKITSYVHRNGIPTGNFSRFSSGERSRIEVAGILALQSLINNTSPSGGLNLLFLDEIIDAMDEKGITGIVEDLNTTLSQCIFLVTQSVYDGTYDKIIKVEKGQDGISRIER